MVPLSANTHDVGRSLVDSVYGQHGTYRDHLKRECVDTLDAFIEEIGDVPAADIPPTSDLYDAYREYCEREGLYPVPRSSVPRAAHRLSRPSDGVPQALGRFTADDLGGVSAAHLREQAFEVPGKTLLERLDERARGIRVDGVEGHGHIDEGLIQQGIGDARRQRGKVFFGIAHDILDVLHFEPRRMLRAGSRVSAASRHLFSHGLRQATTSLTPEGGYAANAREAGRVAAYFGRTVVLPLLRTMRRDAGYAAAAILFAIGWGLGTLALATAVMP